MPRRDQLDGLRAFCFLAVFFFHCGLFPQGHAGVHVFFALSGFLISGILARADAGGLPGFYGRRLLRICPVYYLFLALAMAGGQADGWAGSAASYGLNFQVAFGAAWPAGPIAHLWSLSVEFQFYLLFPPLFLAVREGRRAWLVVALLVCSKAVRWYALGAIPGPWAQCLTPVCGEYLLWGCLFATLPRPRSERHAVACFAVGLAMLVAWTQATGLGGGTHGRGPSPWSMLGGTPDGLGSALVVYSLWWSGGRLAAALSWRPLAYLGTISYGLYLAHLPAIRLAGMSSGFIPGLWRAPWLAAILATVAVAALSWHYFERPIMRLGRRPAPVPRPEPAISGATSG